MAAISISPVINVCCFYYFANVCCFYYFANVCCFYCLQYGHTALMYASLEGRTDVVEMLLAHPGINVNLQEKVWAYIHNLY